MTSMFFVAVTMMVVWIGLCGVATLLGFIFVDQTLSLIIGSSLILISMFGLAGYQMGKGITEERLTQSTETKSGDLK